MNSIAARHGFLLLAAVTLPGIAHAYVGPGAGLSLLTALWGLVAAVVVAVGFVVMWPIRRLLRRRRQASAGVQPAAPVAEVPTLQAAAPSTSAAADDISEDELEQLGGAVPPAVRQPGYQAGDSLRH